MLCFKCESASRRFQLGEGPSRGLLCDYEPSDGPFSSSTRHSARHLCSCPSQSDGRRTDPSKEMSEIGQASTDLPNFEDKYFEQECEVCR